MNECWKDFLDMVKFAEKKLKDVVIEIRMPSKDFWEIVNLIQLVNVVEPPFPDPIKEGKFKLAMGIEVVKEDE